MSSIKNYQTIGETSAPECHECSVEVPSFTGSSLAHAAPAPAPAPFTSHSLSEHTATRFAVSRPTFKIITVIVLPSPSLVTRFILTSLALPLINR